jgi:hypothetical protein
VEPSLYVPVATYACVRPFAIERVVGVTSMLTSTADVTVSVTLPLIPLATSEASIVEVPALCPVATPIVDTVATPASDDVQPRLVVRSFVVPSLYVPVATNVCWVPLGIVGEGGVTAIDTSFASVTVRSVEAETFVAASVAETVVFPGARALAVPLASIEAIVVSAIAQFTEVVRSLVVPSV